MPALSRKISVMVFCESSLSTAEGVILKFAGSISAALVGHVDVAMHKEKMPAERLNPGLVNGLAFPANRTIRSV